MLAVIRWALNEDMTIFDLYLHIGWEGVLQRALWASDTDKRALDINFYFWWYDHRQTTYS
jgi:hypothetical protein